MALSINGVTADTPKPSGPLTDLGAAAVAYTEQGMVIRVIHPNQKLPLRSFGISAPADACAVWTSRPTANIGLACGWENGIFAVCADRIDDPGTRVIRTPTGGHTALYRYPADLNVTNRNDFAALGGADVCGSGGYVLLPPSRTAAGEWTWLNNEPIADAPGWLLDLVATREESPVRASTRLLHDWLADFPFVEFDDFLGAVRLGRALAAKEPDQIFVIEGPPGAGKTLLMNVLALAAVGEAPRLDTMPTHRSDLDKRMSAAGDSLLFDNVGGVPDWGPILDSRAKVQIAITSTGLTIPAEVEPHVCRIRLTTSARHPDILTFTTKNAAALRAALLAIRVLGGGPDEDAAPAL